MSTPFYTFLMRHKSPVEVDDITRLANLAFRDPLFPKQSKNFEEVSSYLETHAPFYFNLTLFDDIWQLYLES
ncbi:YozE family protein [Lactococcus protaetiae]|uniref:UPF0346 protein FLP15_00590 n=1 Tax=Lactococcus protaetiae TaxID=2592653 RepID=A0A514Z5S4_9LACT|nr:YozE family protein [Lactococcus protaetiae]MCL2114140.1 YozE family protein [Streptococcaceae bacterium]QDK69938.1 hypothetical protein FLP15_00590 [Lactococcus protaetiae]